MTGLKWADRVFTGSAGSVPPWRRLWRGLFIDGRYRTQVKGAGWRMSIRHVAWPRCHLADWLRTELASRGESWGFDRCLPCRRDRSSELETALREGSSVTLRPYRINSGTASGRPAPHCRLQPAKIASDRILPARTMVTKIRTACRIVCATRPCRGSNHPAIALCWLLNIRGLRYCTHPVVHGFAVAGHDAVMLICFAPPPKVRAGGAIWART